MDVARTQHGTDAGLVTITDYLHLPSDLRPSQLWCAGTSNGQPCNGPAFPKATHGGPIAPHFASLEHVDGCDHAAGRTLPTPLQQPADSDAAAVLTLTGTPTHPTSSAPVTSPRQSPQRSGQRASVRTVLRVLTSTGMPDDLQVQWHQQPPMLAYEFFVHLASATTARDDLRGYWGRIHQVQWHQPTGSVHLIPRTGPRVIIDAHTSTVLGLTGAPPSPLTDADVLAVAPLRRARSGRLYVLVSNPSAIGWL